MKNVRGPGGRLCAWLLLLVLPAVAGGAMTPETVAARLERALAALTDYQCRLQEYGWAGKVYEEKLLNFYFKQPRLIRVDILKSNKPGDAGSVGVSLNDGKVIGRRGGLLSLFTVTFDKHEPLVTTARGRSLDESDLQSVAERIRQRLVEGKGTVLELPGVYQLVLEPRIGSFAGGLTREIYRLDAGTLLPLSADSYEGSRDVEHAAWGSCIVNAGLPTDLFNVRWDPARLAALGIPTLPAPGG